MQIIYQPVVIKTSIPSTYFPICHELFLHKSRPLWTPREIHISREVTFKLSPYIPSFLEFVQITVILTSMGRVSVVDGGKILNAVKFGSKHSMPALLISHFPSVLSWWLPQQYNCMKTKYSFLSCAFTALHMLQNPAGKYRAKPLGMSVESRQFPRHTLSDTVSIGIVYSLMVIY